jgi:membrane fusion protein YbhG
MKNRMRIILPLLVVAAVIVVLVVRSGGEGDGTLTASGTIEATDADLGFEIPGRIAEVAVREGDRVADGAELARLDTEELDAVVSAARAQLAAAEARLLELERGARPQELAQAEAAARSARDRAADMERDLVRARELHEGGAISRQALDKATTARDLADAALQQATQALALIREGPRQETIHAQRAFVEQASANLARAEATLSKAVIAAPFPGLVTVKHREAGEVVGPGAPVVTILDPDDRWVRIYVREDEIGRVHVGMRAEILSDSYRDRIYEGVVVFIGSEAEFTPRNVQTSEERTKLVYPVKVRITDDPDFELKPGVPADVTLVEEAS